LLPKICTQACLPETAKTVQPAQPISQLAKAAKKRTSKEHIE